MPNTKAPVREIVANLLYAPLGVQYYHGDLERLQYITWELLGCATCSVHVVGDRLNSPFYKHVNTLRLLRELADRQVELQFIHGPQADPQALETLAQVGVELAQVSILPDSHFAVIDGKHVKIEKPHAPNTDEREYVIKYNTSRLGQNLEAKFALLLSLALQRAKPVHPSS